jgi:hypothetical protein
MKLSIEAKVAAAVAVAFTVLTIGAIAQEKSERGAGAANSAALSHMTAQGSSSWHHDGTGDNQVLGAY